MRDELEETKDVVVKHLAKHEHVDVQAMAWCNANPREVRFDMASWKSSGRVHAQAWPLRTGSCGGTQSIQNMVSRWRTVQSMQHTAQHTGMGRKRGKFSVLQQQ
jgi:hypothetical protein